MHQIIEERFVESLLFVWQRRIKFEVDINHPKHGEYEVNYLLNPIPFSVKLFSESSPLNLTHLEARMKQSSHLQHDPNLSKPILLDILREKFSKIDYEQAKQDVLPFIKDSNKLEMWSEEFFVNITESFLKPK